MEAARYQILDEWYTQNSLRTLASLRKALQVQVTQFVTEQHEQMQHKGALSGGWNLSTKGKKIHGDSLPREQNLQACEILNRGEKKENFSILKI